MYVTVTSSDHLLLEPFLLVPRPVTFFVRVGTLRDERIVLVPTTIDIHVEQLMSFILEQTITLSDN